MDFQKAFDSIDREAMFTILPLYGNPQHINEAINALYTNTTIITPDGETACFNIDSGLI